MRWKLEGALIETDLTADYADVADNRELIRQTRQITVKKRADDWLLLISDLWRLLACLADEFAL
jgi:hypothetical protein